MYAKTKAFTTFEIILATALMLVTAPALAGDSALAVKTSTSHKSKSSSSSALQHQVHHHRHRRRPHLVKN